MFDTQSLKVDFTNSRGFKLDARLDLPIDAKVSSYAIICHCFTCTKETLTTSRVSRGLAQRGLGVLRFDFTGLGKSKGDFADSNFTSMVDDVLSANRYLQQHHQAPSSLIGHSMGGTAVLAAACDIPSCTSVITIASPSLPQHVLHHFGKAMPQLEAGIASEIHVAGERYPVKPQFLSDVRQYKLQQKLMHFDKRLLCVRAAQDELIPAIDAEEIISYTSADHKLLDLALADHLFRDRKITETMIEEIHHWIKADKDNS